MRFATKKRLSALCLTLSLGTGAVWAADNDWSQWRGTNRDAKAQFKAPAAWPRDLTLVWKTTVGDGVATPSLVGDKLYVFSREEGGEILRCLNAATGEEVWLDKFESQGASGPAGGFAGPRCTPAVAEGKVVTLGVRGTLSCLDAGTGKVLWRKNEFPGTPMFQTSSSPLIVDGLCVAQLGAGRNGAVVAYDLTTGEQKWKWAGDGPAYASPVVMTVGGAKLVVAMTDSKMAAVAVADGKLAWEAPFSATGGGRSYNASSPMVEGSTIFYGGGSRGAKAVQLEKQGDVFVAKELWSSAEKSVQFNSPVMKDGLIYALSQRDEYYCLSAKDGKTAWSATPGSTTTPPAAGGGFGGRGGRGGGGGYGSIVDGGSVLIALTPKAYLVFFTPGDKEFKQVATYQVSDTETYAYPVVSGNRLFIKDRDSVTLWTVE